MTEAFSDRVWAFFVVELDAIGGGGGGGDTGFECEGANTCSAASFTCLSMVDTATSCDCLVTHRSRTGDCFGLIGEAEGSPFFLLWWFLFENDGTL